MGFDDSQELGLSGAKSAAPIWAEFMKRAVSLPAYRNVTSFKSPPGVISVEIDPETLQLATSECPSPRTEVFIAGTEPHEFCVKHGRHLTEWRPSSLFTKLLGLGKASAAADKNKGPGKAAETRGAGQGTESHAAASNEERGSANPSQAEGSTAAKRGPLSKFFSIFTGKKDDRKKPKSDQSQP